MVNGNDITIKMSRPFPDMDYYASFPAFTAIPQAKDTRRTYGNHPLATGPYMFKDYKPGTALTLVKNPNWDPATDPGRIQAVDGWDFKFGQDTAKLENMIINDHGDGADDADLRQHHARRRTRSIASDKDRLVTGTSPCTYMWFLDMTKINELNVRKAHRLRLPVRGCLEGRRRDRGLTRVPGTAILPPGTAGRVDYDALGSQGQEHRPGQGQGAAEEGRQRRAATRSSSCSRPTTTSAVAAKDEIVKGLEAAGFKATPIASTSETIRTDRDRPEVADQRPLQRLVLGLADRRLVVPGPVGRQPRRPRGHAQPVQLQGGGRWTRMQNKILDTHDARAGR